MQCWLVHLRSNPLSVAKVTCQQKPDLKLQNPAENSEYIVKEKWLLPYQQKIEVLLGHFLTCCFPLES